MPRGTGKTTIVKYSAVWALVYGHRRFLLVFAATRPEARKILAAVKSALRRKNSPLHLDFPEICEPFIKLAGSALLARGQILNGDNTNITTSADELVFPTTGGSKSSGSVVRAVGVNGAFRGASSDPPDETGGRPDFVILDDLQTEAVARNPNRVNDLEEKINAAIEGLSESGYELSMVLTCTVLFPDDLADRYLNPDIYPHWHGIRGQMIDVWPDMMDRWREFRSIRHESAHLAHQFYLDHYDEMRAGARVSWPEKFDPAHFEDALEMALTKWADNERGFWSECQNQPMAPPSAAVVVPAKVIMARVNGLERGAAPFDTYKITAFVDCHDDILYWAAVAWNNDFTGFVLDYDTFPRQNRLYFKKSDGGLKTLRIEFGGSADSALQAGLVSVFNTLAEREFHVEGGNGIHALDRILVDAKFKPAVVESAVRFAKAGVVVPYRGFPITASKYPMSEWLKKPGRVFGHHLIVERIKGRVFESVLSDVNYWKSKTHEKFGQQPGEAGSLTFWGTDTRFHRLIAEHCNAETCQLVSSGKNEVNEWKEKPTKPDNHYFDALTGNLAAASSLGILTDEQKENLGL